jgi:2-keto-4-pentenoate hydratase/2-oxohepta-3-ene-1,7-dioic acid hydratase in catechol pathway
VCVGLNDRVHAAEMEKTVPEEPRIFLKPASAVIGPGQSIVLPGVSQRVEHEAELAVVVGKTMTRLRPEEVWGRVLGYTCVNDVTARDLQKRDGHYTRAKGFDTFCPLGPWIDTGLHPAPVRVLGRVNGETRQDGHTRNQIRDIPTLLAYISSIMTLLPGDVVATGTYGGTGPLLAGDVVEIEVEGVGVLRNPVMAAPTTGVFERPA